MNAITLYIEDLNTRVKDLHPLHRERILAEFPSLDSAPKADRSGSMTVEHLDNMRLRDALNFISYETYWVSKYRDLSDVKPLSVDSDYFAYDRQAMQPLLDALEKGDFELAEALTPAKYRLCGYQEYKEAKIEGEYGIGWAGQFAEIVVPAGIYPVFARVEYPEGMQDLLVDCIYADAMKHRQPMDIDVAESLATRIMHNADFAKAIGITLADLKEQGRTCEAKDFRVFCEEFVRHELSLEEKPALDQQISGAQSRTSSSTPEKSTPDIQR